MFPLSTLVLLLFSLAACGGADKTAETAAGPEVSGTIEGGLRVLTIDPTAADQHFKVYRGDYVRFALTTGADFTIEIPGREASKTYPVPEGEKPYVSFPQEGTYPFSIGEIEGVIEAIVYQAAAYREVTAKQAADLIAEVHPVVLDVRTAGEYADVHLADAWLIPIQELQSRLHELAAHKTDPVFIYCRTGNRSTVAAKFLVDAGFSEVINLRGGIVEWAKHDLPIVK
jgi:rhodanese-related sulfurtransferase